MTSSSPPVAAAVSLAPLSVVTANTTSDDPATCAVGKNGCAPENVANAQNATGFLDADATRWVSKAYHLDTYGKCNPEWLHFKFPEGRTFDLKNVSIDYGFLSWKFVGGFNLWPEFYVANTVGAPLTALSLSDHFVTVTSRINRQFEINDRLDIVDLTRNRNTNASSANAVQELRILWNPIPQGAEPPYLCQMDVFEVVIYAVESVPNSANGGSGSGSGSAANTSALSAGAIAGIVLAALVVVAASALLLVRRHNVKKREMASLPIGDKVLAASK